MIERHDEHSFDLDLILPGEWVLDVGCRGFTLPKMLHHRGCNVVAVEADPDVAVPGDYKGHFVHAAVVSREMSANKKLTLWKHPTDQQAHTVVREGGTPIRVPTENIKALAGRFGGGQFALIKLDCEGAEYGLMHDIADAAYCADYWARQISVEYHDHCGLNPVADMDTWYRRLHERLGKWYEISKFVREVPPWGGHPHYVDCLYTLKREFWR